MNYQKHIADTFQQFKFETDEEKADDLKIEREVDEALR